MVRERPDAPATRVHPKPTKPGVTRASRVGWRLCQAVVTPTLKAPIGLERHREVERGDLPQEFERLLYTEHHLGSCFYRER